ncbi:polysaccharide biosynthesis protein [Brevibacillus fulvus]|uniref:Stage V sporulation protein B n=1 Tax=Brevibacillus fulvus TaxID=1125967 RepID=A0A939BUM2_9BACL|nr:stage V sporulation protein B [Brevibacillus fulvus]
MSKDSLVKGTAILAIAALITRFIGVFQRVPLVHLLGNDGMSSYTIAFNLYSSLLIVATAGLPSALSKTVAEKLSQNQRQEAFRFFQAAVLFSLAIGVVMCILLFLLAPGYAAASGDPRAALATRAIAPAILLFPLIAVLRGFSQGNQFMLSNGVSQVVEQIFRLVASIGLAFLLIGYGTDWAAAGATFGGVVGGVAALLVMLYYTRKLLAETRLKADFPVGNAASSDRKGFLALYKTLFRVSIPIVIYSMAVTLIYNIDSSTIIPLLSEQIGLQTARELNGILGGQAQPLAGLPIILAIALSQSIVPIISGAHAKGDVAEVKQQSSRVFQLALLTGLPIVLLISIGARPISGFLFNYGGTAIGEQYAPSIIAFVTISSLFQIMMQTSGAILMGMGRMNVLIGSVAAGISVKLLGNYLLSPEWGIYGILASTTLCFVVMWLINLVILKKQAAFAIFRPKRWFKLVFVTAVIILLGVGLETAAHYQLHPFAQEKLNQGLNAVVVCGFVLVAYMLLLAATRMIGRQELAQLPGPFRKWFRQSKQTRRG